MAKNIALVFGVVYTLVGILGFIGNPIVGGAEGALFPANTLHNVVHLATGLVLLWAASAGMAGTALKIFGLVYVLVALLGFFAASDGVILGLVDVNTADNWLHLASAIIFLWAGFMGVKDGTMKTMPPASGMPMGK